MVHDLIYSGGERAPVLRRFDVARGMLWERRLPGRALHPRHVCVIGAVAIAPRASGGLKAIAIDTGQQLWQLVHASHLAANAGLVPTGRGDVDAYFDDGSRVRIEPTSGRAIQSQRWSVPALPSPPPFAHVIDELHKQRLHVDGVYQVGPVLAARAHSLALPGDERALEPSNDCVTWLVQPGRHTLLARLAQFPRDSVILDAAGMPLFRGAL